MNDSQMIDYLQITHSMLASRKEWEQVPEIATLTFKAISHLLTAHAQSFQQHKTLINQQSLKIKQLQLRLGSKASKKDIQVEVANCIKAHSFFDKKQDDLVSEYDKLVRESRYDKERHDTIAAEEIKTISEIVADKKILLFQKGHEGKALAQRLQIEQKLGNLRQELRNKLHQYQRELKEAKDRLNEYKNIQSKFQESHHRSVSSNNQEKINFLQHSSRRMNDSLNHIIGHIQSNYFTKEELLKIIESLKTKDKSPIKHKSKEEGKQKNTKDDESEISRLVQHAVSKARDRQAKEWPQFKQTILKELGKTVKIEVVNNLIDSFQKEVLERYQNLSAIVTKLQRKLYKQHQSIQKEIFVKSQKRPEKKSSPHKSIQSIHNSLARLERSISQRQVAEFSKISAEIEQRLKKYDTKLISELDRREKQMCEVIRQTYDQCFNAIKGNEDKDLHHAYQTLFESNMFCRYLYIGTKQCKKQSCIVWEKEVLNTLRQNYIWKGESVMAESPGLYRLQFAMFGQIQTQTYVLLNNEPIFTISKPQFMSSSSRKVVGNYFHQFLLLPSKAKLSFKVKQHFYGQAVLSLQKL